MPGGDRTGPFGEGPLTGRGAGLCKGYDSPGFTTSPGRGRFAGRGFWRGRGGGRGGGRGWRNMFYATGQPGWMRWGRGYEDMPEDERYYAEDDREMLERRAADLRAELKSIDKRLKGNKAKAEKSSSDKKEQ